MFRWLFLAQAVVYLLLMPYLRGLVELGYYPLLLPGLFAVVALLVGYRIGTPAVITTSAPVGIIEPRRYLWLMMCVGAVLYATVSFRFGLLNRRLGSEYMAALYADMPLPALAILRGYEIAFLPAFLIFAFAKTAPIQHRVIVGLAIIASLPFMGIADSRGRLLVIVIFLLCFVRPGLVISNFRRHFRFYLAGLIAIGVFFFYSYQRAANYSSLNNYLLAEVYQRLDGLNLVTQLHDAHLIDNWGQYDGRMFEPLISKIPFLEAAQQAKLLGRTSTKQYFIQDLLKSFRLDDSNSMITDALYFGGLAGVAIAFVILGWLIARSDAFVAQRKMFTHWTSTIMITAFVSSFTLIEQDLVGSIAAFFQTVIVIGLFFLVSCHRQLLPTTTPDADTEQLPSTLEAVNANSA